jgi:general secretion pathway protein K
MSPGEGRMNRRRHRSPPRRQRGIALLVAILLVAFGTIIAAAIAYENAMTARRSAAAYAFDQSLLIAQGAEALAAYGLREVRRSDQTYTYPAQGWGKPLGPIEVVPGVMLQASLEDLQGRFNLNSLVKSDGTADPDSFAAFQRLLAMVGVDAKWAGYIVDWIDPGIDPMIPDGAEDSVYMGQNPPYRTANMYITSVSELLALPGFGRDNYVKIAPYVTALPTEALLNVCTASGVVLDAFVGHQDFGSEGDQTLARNRASANGCFPKLSDYQAAFEGTQWNHLNGKFKQNSSYFRLTSFVTIGTVEFNLYSLLWQDPNVGTVRPLLRSYTPD